jgi:hypothetical protein
MPPLTDERTRRNVIRQWILGFPRDTIAEHIGIGAGTVSSIVANYKARLDDLDFDSIRQLAVDARQQSWNFSDLASHARLHKYFIKSGAAEHKIESFISKVSSSDVPPEKIIELVYQIYEISRKESIPLDNLPDYINQKLEEKQKIDGEIKEADVILQHTWIPFAGILLGRPSSLKTVGIELLRKCPQTYYTDNFSAKSFVSHNTAVTREELEEIDMLPKIRNKLLLTPELAPTFAAKDDDLIQILGIMTRVLDGHGYESDSGAHGHRGYNEKMMFLWIGAAVDIPYKIHRYLGTLGPKLYFLRLPKSEKKTEDEYIAQINSSFDQKVKEVEGALFEYLRWFEMYPNAANQSSLPKFEWNSDKDNVDAKRYVVRLAQLLSYLRGVVPTWHTRDTQGSNYGYGMAIKEECDRAITQLYNLARGHALSRGRNYITLEDIPLVIKVVLSTASIERVTIFDLLLAYKGTMTTSQIADSLNISKPTALKTMTELKALGLVEMVNGNPNTSAKITLDPQFDWVFDGQFLKLRDEFIPSDNREYTKKERKEKLPHSNEKNENSDSSETKDEDDEGGNSGAEAHKEKIPLTTTISSDQQHKEKISSITDDNLSLPNNNNGEDVNEKKLEIKFTPDYEAGKPIFWRVFEELKDNVEGLVSYNKLQEGLVSTGKFFVGEAVLMIEHMEKIGDIEQTEQYHVYRRRMATSPE